MHLNTPQHRFWQRQGFSLLLGGVLAISLLAMQSAHAACNMEKLDPQVANGSKDPALRNPSGCVLNYGLSVGSTASLTLADITSPSVAKHAFIRYESVSVTYPAVLVVADITPTKFGISPTAGDISSTGNGWTPRPDYLNLGTNISNTLVDRIKMYLRLGSPAPVSVSIELYK